MPLVSIVLIFFNEERFIEEAVRSIHDQTLVDWELVLVDDGSTDRSTTIARELSARDERIRYVDHPSHENRGMSASRNVGVAHASAPYIAFLDADDVWESNKLAEQVDLLASMPDVAMICGAIFHWYSWNPAETNADRAVLTGGLADRRLAPPQAALVLRPLGRESPSGTDVMVRRSVFESVGGFEERFRDLYEDQAFLIKVFLRYPVFISSQTWLRYRRHDASCVAQSTRDDQRRMLKVFLDWLQDDVERLSDPRINAAFRRARRELMYRTLAAPAYELYDHLTAHLPPAFGRRARRTVAVRGTRLHKRRMRDETEKDRSDI